jgi:ribose 5-phosphate isomerase
MVTDMDALASAAVQDVRDGMTVGLGDGAHRDAGHSRSCASRRQGTIGPPLRCHQPAVGGTGACPRLADTGDAGCRVRRHLFDGADEVDESLSHAQGTRRRHDTREVRGTSLGATCVFDTVEETGQTSRRNRCVAIEAMSFGLTAVRGALRVLGLDGAIRLNADGTTYETDNGNPIIDSPLVAAQNAGMLRKHSDYSAAAIPSSA